MFTTQLYHELVDSRIKMAFLMPHVCFREISPRRSKNLPTATISSCISASRQHAPDSYNDQKSVGQRDVIPVQNRLHRPQNESIWASIEKESTSCKPPIQYFEHGPFKFYASFSLISRMIFTMVSAKVASGKSSPAGSFKLSAI